MIYYQLLLCLILYLNLQSVFSYRDCRLNTLKLNKKEIIRDMHVNSHRLLAMKADTLPSWLPSFSTAALGGLLFGSDIGSSSSVLRILGSSSNNDLGALSSFQLGEIASASLFGAMLVSFVIIQVGDKNIGRKTELIGASLLFTIGTFIQSLAPSFDLEIVGRTVYGIGIGVAMHVAPLFIAETSPSDIRGKLVSLKEAAIVLGIVLGYGAGALFGSQDNWRLVYESAFPFEIAMIIGAFTVSESPRWLALRGRREEAVESLMKIQGVSNQEAENAVLSMIPESQSITRDNDNFVSVVSDLIKSPYNRKALTIGLGLVFFQQFTGQPSVLYFANRIFESTGLGFEAALGVGVFKFIMTLVSASLVENPNGGRKKLLLYGSSIMTVALFIITYLYSFTDPTNATTQSGIIAAILMFVGAYQVGYGPMSWLILSEIFPLQVRSTALSMGTLSNFASNLLVTLLFEAERESFGEGLLFLQFAVISVVATFFINFQVFETRGLSLEEIELKLKNEVDKATIK